jgi:predicted ABC-type ATPase
MPNLFIIAGPNGAGKTTSAYKVLPAMHVIEFVNADNIARGISPLNPEGVSLQSARVMIKRMDELMDEEKDFIIETTLTTLSYKGFIEKCKATGYNVILIFFWLRNSDLAKQRVKERVAKGGHSIPEEVIERRYYKGIINLKNIFLPLCDSGVIIDNSGDKLSIVARFEKEDIKIHDHSVYNLIFND